MEEQKPDCVLFTAKADFISLMTKSGRRINFSVTYIGNEEMEPRYIGKPGIAETHQL
jgi:hypothetical protein